MKEYITAELIAGLVASIITIIIFVAGFIILKDLFTLSPSELERLEQERTQIEQQQLECEHDWVVTSRYDPWLKSYKTFSKCSKCGKEI